MKTDEQYVAEFDALFEKHLMWTDQRVMDMFRAEHGSLNEDDVLRLFNRWIKKKEEHRVISGESSLNLSFQLRIKIHPAPRH
jgi:hypothetical protein